MAVMSKYLQKIACPLPSNFVIPNKVLGPKRYQNCILGTDISIFSKQIMTLVFFIEYAKGFNP
jgi:hypothetical protein